MLRRIWDRPSRAFVSDATGLIILGVAAIVRAISYAPGLVNVDRSPAHWLEGLLPAPAWSLMWLGIAVVCVAAIIAPRLLPVAVGLTVAINVLWGLSFVGITITGDSSRGYVSSLGYFAVAFLAMWGFGRGRDVMVEHVEKE